MVTALCRPLRLTPAQKAVLMCIADYAHDDGRDWHSVASIMAWTCLSRSTVLDSIKRLATEKRLLSVKQTGRSNDFEIDLGRVRELAAEVQQSDIRGPGAGHQTMTGDVQQPDIRSPGAVAEVQRSDIRGPAAGPEASVSIKEASGKHQKTRATTPAVERPAAVDERVWSDWLALRKAKKAPVTATVLRGAVAEALEADLTLQAFLEVWCQRGSQGLMAEWLKPNERGRAITATPGKATALMDRNVAVAQRYLQGVKP